MQSDSLTIKKKDFSFIVGYVENSVRVHFFLKNSFPHFHHQKWNYFNYHISVCLQTRHFIKVQFFEMATQNASNFNLISFKKWLESNFFNRIVNYSCASSLVYWFKIIHHTWCIALLEPKEKKLNRCYLM